MTNAKHTPGPWRLIRRMGFGFQPAGEQDDEECQIGFLGPNGERVCWFGHTAEYYPTEGDEPSEADARLIAAAPELLEALKGLLDDIEDYQRINNLGGENNHWQVIARAAIAKAEG